MELTDIKKIRKKLGLTQTELAQAANVSQSLIAKIESERIDPTYSKTQKIFQALENLTSKEERKAKDVMSKKIISIKPKITIKTAIQKIKSSGLSQLPVIKNNICLGLISETNILENLDKLDKKTQVKEIMTSPPPIVNQQTKISIIKDLLRYFPVVLVTKKGLIKGIISKSDILTVNS